MTEENKTLIAARAYLARGLSVFPLNGKIPTTDHGVKDASSDDAQIVEWFPRARNIAIAIPAGVVVVDVDPRNGGDDSFEAWCKEHGRSWMEDVPRARTGAGGYHYWFTFDGRRLKKNPAEGIDLLTQGRYVVAPPSTTIDGYRWETPLPTDLGTELGTVPFWLLELATPETRVDTFEHRAPITGDDPLNEAAHRMTSWAQLLARHGWQCLNYWGEADGTKWRHPSSDNQFSATIKHDCLFVYSPNTPFPVTEPGDPHGVTLYTALETLDYHGDRKACVQALRDNGYLPEPATYVSVDELIDELTVAPTPAPTTDDDLDLPLGAPIDWPALWRKEDDIEQRWLSEPIVARGRAHALYAGAKTGKSLLLLQLAAALATGREFLDKPAHDPIPVLYADYEMTEDDVKERVENYGYGPDDLELLHYFLLGSGSGLDTPDGGAAMYRTAHLLQVELVIVDTTSRAVAGAENDSDSIRAFYRYCGAYLKRSGIAWVRLDHSGKDVLKGQRGASAKNDDVDVVWRMTALDEGSFDLEATHQRMGWVDRRVPLMLHEDGRTGLVDWRRRGGKNYSDKTKEAAELLDKLDAPLDLSTRKAAALLRANHWTGRNSTIVEAFSWRREVHKNDWLKTGSTPGSTSDR